MPDPLGVMWGKSDASGSMHLLIGHLLDTAAVGELIWDSYLSPAVKRELDGCSGGRGRSLLAVLCGLHDVGKATPAFQVKDDALAAAVHAAGFDWPRMALADAKRWHHTLAGAVVVRTALGSAGWDPQWVWPLIAGHHGCVPRAARLEPPAREVQGRAGWPAAQLAFVERVAAELGVDLADFAGGRPPTRGIQLALSGFVIMADWIASDERNFDGVPDLAKVSMAEARARARRSWARLGLRGGWDAGRLAGPDEPDLVRRRFAWPARSAQCGVVALAEGMETPGLLVVEAPMGEGKTEAALAAVEVLARRFGADGVFVGMPTQATGDAMFKRVRKWLSSVDERVPVALLHGRSGFNKEWAELRKANRFGGVSNEGDPFGVADPCGDSDDDPDGCCADPSGLAAAEWFLGRKRGLLAPVAVGTIDQLLHAAIRTRHVMLRHAGLAGRVVVLDEVHAYDCYMSQFLFEALRWLGDARVPVVLLSATLPPALRADLVRAYAQGLTLDQYVQLPETAEVGYPRATSVTGRGGTPAVRVVAGRPWRASLQVDLEVLPEAPGFDPGIVADAVVDAVQGGGCALVVCNVVDRAQAVFRQLRPVFGGDVVLLHARLTAAARAERTERLLELLGKDGDRPDRLVIVATQVAEQSFDVDVDVVFSDLAPIDLLLQRAGRLHRHERPLSARPEGLRTPRLVVSGVRFGAGAPDLPPGSCAVYGRHALLRSAALVEAARSGWSVPAQVPELVATGYSEEPLGPIEWADTMAAARVEHEESTQERAGRASLFLLAGEHALGEPTLAGLHERRTDDLDDDDTVAAVVRDGDPSVEVVLVRGRSGAYRTLSGRSLGPQGEAVTDERLLEEVVGSTVRLPARPEITKAALDELRPLSGWAQDPWLSKARALVLDQKLSVVLRRHRLSYDDELGLVVERNS